MTVIRRFSASFNNINPNFLVAIPELFINSVSEPFTSLFAVCKNIISRGGSRSKIPETMKNYLSNQVEENTTYTYPDGRKTATENSLKNNILHNYLIPWTADIFKNLSRKEISLLCNSFCLDCETLLISPKCRNVVQKTIDFYSPLLDIAIVVESDDLEYDENNTNPDADLDIMDVFPRVMVVDNSIGNSEKFSYRNYVEEIKSSLENELENYCELKNILPGQIPGLYIIRIELMLIQLLCDGVINIEAERWKFNVVSDDRYDPTLFKLACEDLFNIIHGVSVLMDLEIKQPEICFSEDDSSIKIDIRINEYLDICPKDEIFVRNDRFLYCEDFINNADVDYRDRQRRCSPTTYNNYFTVSTGSFKYNIILNKKTDEALLKLLARCFDFDNFINEQKEIIIHCLNGDSTIGIMPTGSGKSLCYQFSSLLLPGPSLIISPLNSLMLDQKQKLLEYGINNTVFLNSNSKNVVGDAVFNNHSLMTYVTPERFFNTEFMNFIKECGINYRLLAIDEAHCLSEWGHSFRTSYLCIVYSIKDYFSKDICLIGLTATASPNVAEDILSEFNTFRNNTVLIQSESLTRNNLELRPKCLGDYSSKEKMDGAKREWIVENVLEDADFEKTVIFTKTKTKSKNGNGTSCTDLFDIVQDDFPHMSKYVDCFTGGDDSSNSKYTNSEKIEMIKSGEIRLLFATSAFGMGIDIPDIRRTVHCGLPSSIEDLYQQFGRAGRDGALSICDIIFVKENEELLNNLASPNVQLPIRGAKELGMNLFLFNKSNKNVEEELTIVMAIYEYIIKINKMGKYSFDINEIVANSILTPEICGEKYQLRGNDIKPFIEKSLYRLLTLNLIRIWSVRYGSDIGNPEFTDIEANNVAVCDAVSNLKKYIQRYDSVYSVAVEINNVRDVLRELIKWNYHNFTRTRLESMRLVYKYCYDNQTTGHLMDAITNFLTIDQTLYNIEVSKKVKNWFDYINKNDAPSRSGKIDRFIEDGTNTESVYYLYVITALQLGENNYKLIKERLNLALEKIKYYPEREINTLISKTFNLITDIGQRELICELFCNHFPSKYTDIYIHSDGSEIAEYYLMCEFVSNMKSILEALNDRS